MAKRNDLDGWSLRAAGRYADLSVNTVRTLLRLDPWAAKEGPLSPVDVLCIRVLGEIGANRSVNRGVNDDRSARLKERDERALGEVRKACSAGAVPDASARLLVYGETARVVRKDHEVLTTLDEHSDETVLVLPIGQWLAEIRDISAKRPVRAATTKTSSDTAA